MVLATYSIVRATLNSEEVNQECVSRCLALSCHFHFLSINQECVSRYLAFALHFICAFQLQFVRILRLNFGQSLMIPFLGAGSCAKEGGRSLEEEMAPDCLLN